VTRSLSLFVAELCPLLAIGVLAALLAWPLARDAPCPGGAGEPALLRRAPRPSPLPPPAPPPEAAPKEEGGCVDLASQRRD